MILINYDIGMIILHEHNGHGTSQAELQTSFILWIINDNYKYWYSNITGFSLTVLNYYILIITNIVTMLLCFFTKYYQISFTKYFTTNVTTIMIYVFIITDIVTGFLTKYFTINNILRNSGKPNFLLECLNLAWSSCITR